jgi:C4-dicarboxylate transporter DctM subunit
MEMVLLLGLLLFFIAISLPIGISIGLATLITMVTTTDTPTVMMAQYAFTSLDSFPLMAIPFFIMAGNLMSTGGISRCIVNFANEIIGELMIIKF